MTRLQSELEHHLSNLEALFCRDDVTDIHLQVGGFVWSGNTREEIVVSLDARRLLTRYLGTCFETPITRESPTFSAAPLEIFGASWRVTVMAPPVAGEDVVTFRRISSKPFSLDSFGASLEQQRKLLDALAGKQGILVIGQQGSGKTAFSTALLRRLLDQAPDLRIALIEDTPEIFIPAESNHIALTTSSHRSYEDLITEALRTSADLIIIGEVRDRAVSHLVTAAITGHGALTTFHAASPRAAYERIRLLMQMGGTLTDPYVVHVAFPIVAQLENRRLLEIHHHTP